MLHAQSKMLLGGESEESGSGSSSDSTTSEATDDAHLHPPLSPTLSDEIMTLLDQNREQDLPEHVGEAEGTLSTAERENNDDDDGNQKVPCIINGVANHWSCVKCPQTFHVDGIAYFPHTGGYQQEMYVGLQTPLGQHPMGILVLVLKR